MQVYVELAVLENFCMDFTLLYSAKLASKNRAHFMRIALGAALGACFAVTFPLFKIGTVWQVVLKIISGLIICLAAGRFKGVKSYIKFTGFFLAFTALLGGALVGVFSLTGLEYDSGGGYFLLLCLMAKSATVINSISKADTSKKVIQPPPLVLQE